VKIRRESLEAMTMHALDSYPDECCGVVVGTDAQDETVVRIRNIQDEMHAADPERYPRTARTAYAGDPADLKAALDVAERPGGSLRAFYHSHPDHAAYFSEEDVRQATPFGEPSYPQALQIVISVDEREVRDVKAFAWSDESSTYQPVELEPTIKPA
jgi:proteasome lid subunit RPN8/RPN11